MSRIKGLELLFNLEKTNIQSKEDCVIAVMHCLLINENFHCVGTGENWSKTDSVSTELLPENWNSNEGAYTLRYRSKDDRILLKAIKMEHILQINALMNEDIVASVPVPVNNYISDDYCNYSSAYKDLKSLIKLLRQGILENLYEMKRQKENRGEDNENKLEWDLWEMRPRGNPVPPTLPQPGRSPLDFRDPRDPFQPRIPKNDDDSDYDPRYSYQYPKVGGNDLYPLGGTSGGGMFVDPSSFGIPSRPTLPEFGVGSPGVLPKGSVPPGARFDPIVPPIRPDKRENPDPDRYPDRPPPDFEN